MADNTQYSESYTHNELMAATVARMIRNDDNVVVGMGVPIISGAVAAYTTAPDAFFIYECGGVGAQNARIPWTVDDNPTTDNALAVASMIETLGDLQNGRLSLAILGGAEVDKYGNLNSSMFPGDNDDYQHPTLRLPGPGGATDLAIFAGRTLIMMKLAKGKFVNKVKYITSPGYLEGGDAREKLGYPGNGPEAVLTNKGIFRFDPVTKEMYLDALFPGVTVDEVKELIEWDLKVADNIKEVEPPTVEQVKIMAMMDPAGIIMNRSGGIFESIDKYYDTMRDGYLAMQSL